MPKKVFQKRNPIKPILIRYKNLHPDLRDAIYTVLEERQKRTQAVVDTGVGSLRTLRWLILPVGGAYAADRLLPPAIASNVESILGGLSTPLILVPFFSVAYE